MSHEGYKYKVNQQKNKRITSKKKKKKNEEINISKHLVGTQAVMLHEILRPGGKKII